MQLVALSARPRGEVGDSALPGPCTPSGAPGTGTVHLGSHKPIFSHPTPALPGTLLPLAVASKTVLWALHGRYSYAVLHSYMNCLRSSLSWKRL